MHAAYTLAIEWIVIFGFFFSSCFLAFGTSAGFFDSACTQRAHGGDICESEFTECFHRPTSVRRHNEIAAIEWNPFFTHRSRFMRGTCVCVCVWQFKIAIRICVHMFAFPGNPGQHAQSLWTVRRIEINFKSIGKLHNICQRYVRNALFLLSSASISHPRSHVPDDCRDSCYVYQQSVSWRPTSPWKISISNDVPYDYHSRNGWVLPTVFFSFLCQRNTHGKRFGNIFVFGGRKYFGCIIREAQD